LNIQYLDLLAHKYDSEEIVATEIINLEAILNLPKGTEHFVSDLHGEYNAFQHVLRNGSGRVKEKIRDLFQDELSDTELNEFATLVYYPEEKLMLIRDRCGNTQELHQWYTETIARMIKLMSQHFELILLNLEKSLFCADKLNIHFQPAQRRDMEWNSTRHFVFSSGSNKCDMHIPFLILTI
jgi:hypothetical protein